MNKAELKCPVCAKAASRHQYVLAHFKHELSGWDSLRDASAPHVVWATRHGIRVGDGGYISDEEMLNLKGVLYTWLDASAREQTQSSSGAMAESTDVFPKNDMQ